MRPSILSTLVAILLSVNFSSGQELIDLFIRYYPEQLLGRRNFKKAENARLIEYAQLDPGIIYFYMENLNKRFRDEITNPDSNLTTILGHKIRQSQKLKRLWAEKQIEMVRYSLKVPLKRREILGKLSKYKYRRSLSDSLDLSRYSDLNRMYFFHYLCLIHDTEIIYDPGESYAELLINKANELVSAFNEAYKNLARISRKKRRIWIDRALRYSFLFKDSYLKEYPSTTNCYLYEFINEAVSPDYINHDSIGLLFQSISYPFEAHGTIRFRDPFDEEFRYDYNIMIRNSVSINLGFKVKTQSKYLPFSDINMFFGYSTSQSTENSFEKTELWSGIKVRYGTSVRGSYMLSDYRNFDHYALTFQLFTPIFFVTKSLHLDFGIAYTFQRVSFQYDYYVDGEVFYSTQEPPDMFEDKTFKVVHKWHLMRPIFAIGYYILRPLDIRLDFGTPSGLRWSMDFYFNL